MSVKSSSSASRRVGLLASHFEADGRVSGSQLLGSNQLRDSGRSPRSPRAFSTSAPRLEPGSGGSDALSTPVAKLLAKNEVFQPCKGSAQHSVLSYHSNAIPANSLIEDAWSVQREVLSSKSPSGEPLVRTFFTVTDGHLGPDTAAVVARYLPSYIGAELGRVSSSPKTPSATPDPLDPPLDSKADAISRAFDRLDSDIVNGGIAAPPGLQPQHLALQGACCIATVLDPEQNGIFVAGAGDCRAVLGRKGTSGGWEMIEASFDHTLKREEEVARLKEEHPGEPQEVLTASGRVLGVLMPSRAFGDSDFKWPQETQKVLGSIPFPAKIYKSPPYMTADPDVFFLPYGDPSAPLAAPGAVSPPNPSFLILATDGLWDFINSAGAVACIASLIEAGTDFTKVNPATALIREAFSGGGVSKPEPRKTKRLDQLLSIPVGRARNFRDDVTVLVVFLGNGGGGWASEYAASVDGARLKGEVGGETDGMTDVDPKGLGGEKQPKVHEWVASSKKSSL